MHFSYAILSEIAYERGIGMPKRNILYLGLVAGVATAVVVASYHFLTPEQTFTPVKITPAVDTKTTMQELKNIVGQFVRERGWEKTDTPKTLTVCIAIEAAELMKQFQFVSDEQSHAQAAKNRQSIAEQLADVVIYALAFANQANVDLSSAVKQKMEKNSQKYALNKVKGKPRHRVLQA